MNILGGNSTNQKGILYYLLLPVLIVVWILSKIGQIPLLLITNLALTLYKSYQLACRFASKFFSPFKSGRNLLLHNNSAHNVFSERTKGLRKSVLEYQKEIVQTNNSWHFNLFSGKKRGRPRTQPYIAYNRRLQQAVTAVKKGKIKRFLNKFIPTPIRVGIALCIVAFIVFGYSYFLITIAHTLPSPERLSSISGPQTTTIYDRNGKLLARFYEGRNRTLVKLEDIPPYLVNATIAIEDKHYRNHPGIDFFAMARAIVSNSQQKSLQGGSTITQQLIKNTLLTSDRTYERKVKEVFLAYWAERIFSKDEILQMYFNETPYGGTAWGIQAASEAYFNKRVSHLDLAEAAFLAGLPKSPTEFSPFGSHPELGKQRQKEVLARMVEDRYITNEQANEAFAQDLAFNSPNTTILAPHFVFYIRSLLAQKYGEKTVSQGGLKVMTSLDIDLQDQVQNIVSEEVSKLTPLNVTNGAAMVTDPTTGQILAMIGSKDYYDPNGGNYNVTLALRQPGSAIKPFTYATAFKQGYSPGTILLDTPTVFRSIWETYAPVNYDGKFHGAVTIRTALGSSYNVPAVKMLNIVGIHNMIQIAKDLGITTLNDPNRYGLSLTLGGGEVRMIDMMTAYGTLSQNGIKRDPVAVLKVTDSSGNVIEDNTSTPGVKVLSAGVSYLITSILTDNNARTPAFGPKSLLVIPGHDVAVKTGTTDNKKDNVTYGYTPNWVVGVWVGNMDGTPMHPSLTSGVTGAAPIWNKVMTMLIQNQPNLAFVRPPEVVEGSVDGRRDLIVSGTPSRSVVGTQRRKVKDDKTGQERENITFTDPFNTYSADQTGTIIIRP